MSRLLRRESRLEGFLIKVISGSFSESIPIFRESIELYRFARDRSHRPRRSKRIHPYSGTALFIFYRSRRQRLFCSHPIPSSIRSVSVSIMKSARNLQTVSLNRIESNQWWHMNKPTNKPLNVMVILMWQLVTDDRRTASRPKRGTPDRPACRLCILWASFTISLLLYLLAAT